MTWRIWSPVGSTSSSNASFETSFSSDAASALDEKRYKRSAWKAAASGEILVDHVGGTHGRLPLKRRRSK
jgi:hypothetical protein